MCVCRREGVGGVTRSYEVRALHGLLTRVLHDKVKLSLLQANFRRFRLDQQFLGVFEALEDHHSSECPRWLLGRRSRTFARDEHRLAVFADWRSHFAVLHRTFSQSKLVFENGDESWCVGFGNREGVARDGHLAERVLALGKLHLESLRVSYTSNVQTVHLSDSSTGTLCVYNNKSKKGKRGSGVGCIYICVCVYVLSCVC